MNAVRAAPGSGSRAVDLRDQPAVGVAGSVQFLVALLQDPAQVEDLLVEFTDLGLERGDVGGRGEAAAAERGLAEQTGQAVFEGPDLLGEAAVLLAQVGVVGEQRAAAGSAARDVAARLATGDTVVVRLPARGVPYPPELRVLADAGLLVRIGRPSRWGNPYRLPAGGTDAERADVVARYRAYLETRPDLLRQLPGLRGKALGCHCAPLECHGDVLADLANRLPG